MTTINETIKRLESKIADAQHFGADGFTIMLDDALAIIAALKGETPAAPEKPVAPAPAAKAKKVKLTPKQRSFLEQLLTSHSIYVGSKSYDWISTVKSLQKRGFIQGARGNTDTSYTITKAGREALANS